MGRRRKGSEEARQEEALNTADKRRAELEAAIFRLYTEALNLNVDVVRVVGDIVHVQYKNKYGDKKILRSKIPPESLRFIEDGDVSEK